jgi:hypothetical protein
MTSPSAPADLPRFRFGVSHSTGVVVDHNAGGEESISAEAQLSRGRDAGTINHLSRGSATRAAECRRMLTMNGYDGRVVEGELKDRVGSRTAPVEG